jgi:hypothetical protein
MVMPNEFEIWPMARSKPVLKVAARLKREPTL